VTERFEVRKVQYMPTDLEPGILYVAEEFGAAAHLCACGCGVIVRTPLDDTEWSLEETEEGPSLYPSIGNWQEPCQSHYWIERGNVKWAPKWTSGQIEAGRSREQERRDKYYEALYRKQPIKLRKLWNWLRSFLGI
jgi:Family of unknown function (DUF6527)